MNGKSNTPKKQAENCGRRIVGRSGKRRKDSAVVLSAEQEAAVKQMAEEISKGLKSSTWRELEAGGKFSRNEKLTFIKDDMLIVGCDIGSDTHMYERSIRKGVS